MKAAYIRAPFGVEVREVPQRETGPDDVRVAVRACGICGTDYTSVSVGAKEWEPVGHEIAGVVERVGSRVTHVREGDTVTLETGTYCRTCDECRNGRYDLCNKGPNFWLKGPMGFAERIVVPKECVVPYEGLSFAQASLAEPLGVALDLARTADIEPGDDVLVVGLGPIGLMALRLARLAGARRIYAASRSHSKRRIDLARAFGADEVVLTDRSPVGAHRFDRGGVARALVTAPPRTIPEALEALRVGGILAYVGIEYGPGARIEFDANAFHFKKLQLRASHASPALYFPRALELLKSGAVDGEALISHTFRLHELGAAFAAMRDDKASVVKMVMLNDG